MPRKSYGNTILIIRKTAVLKRYCFTLILQVLPLEICWSSIQVQFLLDSGARVDERALCGATALHFAAECGHAAVVCALIDHNAKMLTNENGELLLDSIRSSSVYAVL